MGDGTTIGKTVPTFIPCPDALDMPGQVQDSFYAYPNPANGLVYLSRQFDSVVVYDTQGRKIDALSNGSQIDVSGYPNGIYLVRLTTGANQSTVRLVKN